jgi:hypothetical protein
MVIGIVALVVVLLALVAVALMLPELRRYMKIRSM